MFNTLKKIIETNNFTGNLFSMDDGRLASALSEDNVYDWIVETTKDTGFEVLDKPPIRFWYDICLKYKDIIIPINIKITNGKTADNVSSKEGLFYALTGLNPKKSKINTWERYIKTITDNAIETDADYYFVVVFKDTKEVLFTSLKHIQTLTPNGNNLPFQCNWGKNKILTDRNEKEQIEYLKSVFVQSYIKRAPALDLLLDRWGK